MRTAYIILSLIISQNLKFRLGKDAIFRQSKDDIVESIITLKSNLVEKNFIPLQTIAYFGI